jgi:hypothetical protein
MEQKSIDKCQGKIKPALSILIILISVILIVSLTVNICGQADSDSIEVTTAKLLWEKAYGGPADDRAYSAIKTVDGYIIVGSSRSIVVDRTVGWVLKLNPDGDVLWNLSFPMEVDCEFRQVLSLDDGFLLVGNLMGIQNTDGYVARVTMDGMVVWNLTLDKGGMDKLLSASVTDDAFVLVGLTCSLGSSASDAWFVKIDKNGNIVWSKTWGSLAEDALSAVVCDRDSYYVAGYANAEEGKEYDFLLLKLDAQGEVLWNQTFGGLESDKAYGIAQMSDGFVMVGDTRSKGLGDSDGWAVKVDSDGEMLWDTVFGGEGFDRPTCVALSMDGGVLVGGFTFSFGNGKRDFWLTKLDGSGVEKWSFTVGKSAYEEAYAVVESAFDEYVLVGWVNYFEGGPYDYYVVKVQP